MSTESLSNLYTVEHLRAQKAVAMALGKKEYRAAANRFVSMLLNNGLLQTLTFFEAKDQLIHRHVADYLQEWLCQREGRIRLPDELRNHICSLNLADYRAATVETLAYATWLKRFADAKFKASKKAVMGESQKTEKQQITAPGQV